MCPNCNAPVREDSEFCTNCGAAVRTQTAAPTAGEAPMTAPAPPREPIAPYSGPPASGFPGPAARPSTPPFSFDVKRLATPDLVIGGATVVTLISLFLPWFGVLGFSTSGMSLHGYLVIALLAALVLLAYLALRAGWETSPIKLPIAHAPLLLIGTGVQLLFVLIAFLQSDGLGHQFGAYLALLAALIACGVIAVPVIRSVIAAQQGGNG